MSAEPDDGQLADLTRRGKAYRSWWVKNREPKRLDEVVARLMQRRGYAEVHLAGEIEEAWSGAAGRELDGVASPGRLSRGTLEVVAADSLTVQELTFQKEELLNKLQRALPEAGIRDLRFRVGAVG